MISRIFDLVEISYSSNEVRGASSKGKLSMVLRARSPKSTSAEVEIPCAFRKRRKGEILTVKTVKMRRTLAGGSPEREIKLTFQQTDETAINRSPVFYCQNSDIILESDDISFSILMFFQLFGNVRLCDILAYLSSTSTTNPLSSFVLITLPAA